MRYQRAKILGATYFFTVVTNQRRPLLRDWAAINALESAIELVRVKRPFEISAQVILPDHLHTLWSLPEEDDDYPTRWRLIKEAFTRWHMRERGALPVSPSRSAKGEQSVWQRRYWEHVIRDDQDFENHLDYIHFNPVKHGLAAAPLDWPYSTFKAWVARQRYDPNWGTDRLPEIAEWSGIE